MKKNFTLRGGVTAGAFLMALPLLAAPEVVTNSYIARGSTFALGRMTVENVDAADLEETGFCYNTAGDPTVADNCATKIIKHNGDIYHIQNLEPSTVYYMRAYAKTKDGEVAYGDAYKVITIPKGHITWEYDNGGSAEENARINAAVEGAVDYWNTCLSVQSFHPNVHYGAQTPTADCSYGGWMRVGPNASYQAIGTIMHEMNHGVGVGQHSVWYGPDSPWRTYGKTGTWLGWRANYLVRFLQNSKTATLNGDGTHMWPYGINGAHEDDHTEILYLANGLVTQALHEDALPPEGKYHTPSYTFEHEDNVKYYLKSEDPAHGYDDSFLIEGLDGELVWTKMSAAQVVTDDAAAWYLTFDPVTQMYFFKNAATGHYISYVTKSGKHIYAAVETTTPGTNETIQLTMYRKYTTFNKGKDDEFKTISYWMVHPNNTATPRALNALDEGKTSSQAVDQGKNAVGQRWFILPADKVGVVESGVETVAADETNIIFPTDIYGIDGRIVKRNAANLDNLDPGIYIVGRKKVIVK